MSDAALFASLVAFIGLWLCSWPLLLSVGVVLAFFAPVAVFLGIASRFKSPDRFAIWAIVIGVFVSLYLPSLLVPFVNVYQVVPPDRRNNLANGRVNRAGVLGLFGESDGDIELGEQKRSRAE